MREGRAESIRGRRLNLLGIRSPVSLKTGATIIGRDSSCFFYAALLAVRIKLVYLRGNDERSRKRLHAGETYVLRSKK